MHSTVGSRGDPGSGPLFQRQSRKRPSTGWVRGPEEERVPEYLLALPGGQGARDAEVDSKFWYLPVPPPSHPPKHLS